MGTMRGLFLVYNAVVPGVACLRILLGLGTAVIVQCAGAVVGSRRVLDGASFRRCALSGAHCPMGTRCGRLRCSTLSMLALGRGCARHHCCRCPVLSGPLGRCTGHEAKISVLGRRIFDRGRIRLIRCVRRRATRQAGLCVVTPWAVRTEVQKLPPELGEGERGGGRSEGKRWCVWCVCVCNSVITSQNLQR